MSHPTKRQVRARVKWWQRRLGLQGWKLTVTFGPDADDAEAACLAMPEYRTATLHFDLTKIDVAELDNFVAHEALHCVCWPLANAAHALAGGDASKEEWVRTAEEGLVTALEHLLVGMMPAE